MNAHQLLHVQFQQTSMCVYCPLIHINNHLLPIAKFTVAKTNQ